MNINIILSILGISLGVIFTFAVIYSGLKSAGLIRRKVK